MTRSSKVYAVLAAGAIAALAGCASAGGPHAATAATPKTSAAATQSALPPGCPSGTVEGTGGACVTRAKAARQVREQKAAAAKAAARARRQAAARRAAHRLAHTLSYIVNGSPADVTYGPSGSDMQGSVPMDVQVRLASPEYYAISAQLSGGGTVTCQIRIGTQVISQATATGSYNIASCEIVQSPLDGSWQDANSG